MTTETWYAFQDPITKREYYFDPISNKTTWTLPTSSSGTPVKMAKGAPPGSIPASPMSITGDMIPPTPAGFKVKKEKNQTKDDGSSNKRGFRKRGVAVAIGSMMVLNTLGLGILVKVMYNSSIVDVDPISDSEVVPPADNVRVEAVDVDSSEIAEDVALPEDDGRTHHDAHSEIDNTETAPIAAEEEVKELDSNPEEDDCEKEVVSVNEAHIEKEAIVSDSPSSSETEDYVEEEAIVSDSSLSSDDEGYIEEEAVMSTSSSSSDGTISKRLTRKKLFSIISPVIPIIIGYGAARIAVVLIARVALTLSPPAAPVVVAQASGPISIIKAFLERFLGGPSPAAIVVKDPTQLEKIANVFAKLMKIK